MKSPDTLAALREWRLSSQPGQRFCCHHRGFLANDARIETPGNKVVVPIRTAVVEAYLTGNFELVQERHGDGDFSYYIVRRRLRDAEFRHWIRSELEARRGHTIHVMARRTRA